MKGTLLIVDDDQSMCELLADGLRRHGHDVRWTVSPAQALALLAQSEIDAVVTDLNMRGTSGIELCRQIVAGHPQVPVIVITAYGSLETAVEAMRAGAWDFVAKPLKLEALALTLARALEHRALRHEVQQLRQAYADAQGYGELLGKSNAMQQAYALIERVAATPASVLITGESGTGKELVARALHARGPRAAGPFVAVNCSALPEALLESELFGHARGAFTDARGPRKGLFREAQGGTLFLDEIGDLPLGLQPKLLRALQERRIRPVGADTETEVDVRFLSATNQDLETAVEERRFREDLFFRINVVQVRLPPLRTRGADVLLLAQHFLSRFAAATGKPVRGLSPEAARRLSLYPWPGNVRELSNCIERAVTLAGGEEIEVSDLAERVAQWRPSVVVDPAADSDSQLSLEEVERRHILRVIESVRGNKALAARVLGLDRRTLYRKLERYGVASDDPGSSTTTEP